MRAGPVIRVSGLAFLLISLAAGALLGSGRPAGAYQETGYTLPFYARWRITCDYGVLYSSCNDPHSGYHWGIDYSLGDDPGNPTYHEVVAAAAAGRALACAKSSLAGWAVLINHGGGNRTRYLHLDEPGPLIPAGTQRDVARGEIIGYEGRTGDASGVHLHFETRQGAGTFQCDQQTSGNVANPHTLWQDSQPDGNYADFAPASASVFSTRTDVFVRGSNNQLYQRTNGAGGWVAPIAGSCLRSAAAATSWSTTRLDVFVRGCDNAIWHNWWVGSGGWYGESLGGCTLGAPAVASWGSNNIGLFVRGCDNVVWKRLFTGTWSAWTAISTFAGPTCAKSGPSAASWGTNRYDVVYRSCNSDNQVVWITSTNGGSSFATPQGLGGCTMVSPSIASWTSGNLEVLYRGCGPAGSGEALFHKSYNGGTWSGWTSVSGGTGCLASGPGSDAWAPDKLDVFVRSCDSPPWAYKNAFNTSWSGYTAFAAWPP